MSLEKKSVHVRLSVEMHDRLSVLAGLENNDNAEHAAYLLEKTIVGETNYCQLRHARLAVCADNRAAISIF